MGGAEARELWLAVFVMVLSYHPSFVFVVEKY